AAGFELDRIHPYLTYATVLGFDFHGSWDPVTNHNSNLFTDPADPSEEPMSADAAVSRAVNGGVPASKIVLAVPAFGRGYSGVPNVDNGLYQPFTGMAGPEDGDLPYRSVTGLPGARVHDQMRGAAWIFNASA